MKASLGLVRLFRAPTKGQAWRHMSLVLVWQADLLEVKANLVYKVSFRTAKATQRNQNFFSKFSVVANACNLSTQGAGA